MTRILNVIRMQLVNRAAFVWIPVIILFGSLTMTLAIYAIIASSGIPGPYYGGGAQAPLWYFGVVGIQALALTFPFSQAMSVTRREFFLGTILTAMLTSAVLAAVFVVGGFLEEATAGWGMEGYFFLLPWVWEAGPAAAGLFFFSLTLTFFIVGFWVATVYRRFGSLALTVLLVGLGALLVAALFVIARLNAWAEVFTWFAELGALGLGLRGLVVVVVLGGVSFLTLRRATV